MTPGLAEAVVLRDIIPLLLPLGKYGAIVQLSIAKADGQVRYSPLCTTPTLYRYRHYL